MQARDPADHLECGERLGGEAADDVEDVPHLAREPAPREEHAAGRERDDRREQPDPLDGDVDAAVATNRPPTTVPRITATAAETPSTVNAAPSVPIARESSATRTTSPAFAGASVLARLPAA